MSKQKTALIGTVKQSLIDEILTKDLPVIKVVELMKRNIVKRTGPDLSKEWVWNVEFLRYYDGDALQDILDDINK